ncbi:MAG: carboxypeptidase-like regulatory domain-containing protein [Nitrospirota bacterium]
MRTTRTVLLICCLNMLFACSPTIYGTLQLLDPTMQPIAPAKESPEGTVINMINTTSSLEQASHSVTVNAEGKYESEKGKLAPGMYKVEASRIGYQTDTQTVEITKFGGKKVEFKLKKIAEGKRKSIEGSRSDEDKIVNPGEVNIQPPTM